ncbi:bifunctional DNA-formamidopyrimidine glycosylase/DNA-(apurinic or apyrimidinic site) lyase [Thermoleophilia bacterium SCSIO 60948]|nr:bifunctional DNA-formamidopyrimidine glycosylase/DNA-(apurinic or apyrimidinic site) lyase [Thermoleophilia bacterium SCSIO 60948]
MPELPEVETVRTQLEPGVVGRRIVEARILDPRWCEPESPELIEDALEGARIEAVRRRGKYLVMELDGERALVMHLRMTGNFILRPPGSALDAELTEVDRLGMPRLYESSPDAKYLRFWFEMDDGGRVLFTDPRRFGTGVLLEGEGIDEHLRSRVGIEPLTDELTAEAIGRLAAGRRAPLKSFLLVQGGIAGIGNIYADEALWLARLHPLSPAGSMRPEHHEALRAGIVEALEAGLANGGASIDDYRDARGEKGSMQDEFAVHTREGEACPREDGGVIRRIVVGGRSTYFCPVCQKRLRRRARRRPAARRQSV